MYYTNNNSKTDYKVIEPIDNSFKNIESPRLKVSNSPSNLVSNPPSNLVSNPPSNLVSNPPSNLVSNSPSNLVSNPPSNLVSNLVSNSQTPTKFPLWLLIIILVGLFLIGIGFFLQIQKKYSFSLGKKKSNFGIYN